MSYYWDAGPFDEDRLYHDCHRGKRQTCPTPRHIEKWGADEDGYFRGARAGKYHSMLKGSPFDYSVIRCKSCGEEYTW